MCDNLTFTRKENSNFLKTIESLKFEKDELIQSLNDTHDV
jgi:hypothetical protein